MSFLLVPHILSYHSLSFLVFFLDILFPLSQTVPVTVLGLQDQDFLKI